MLFRSEFTIDTTNVLSRDGVGVYDPNEVNHYLISYHNDVLRFWINDLMVASIDCPSFQPGFTSSSNMPAGFRVWNGASAPTAARQLYIGFVSVASGDHNTNKPWSHAMVGSSQGAYQIQQGAAASQTANWTNSSAPASATLSNTTAGYTTLGGQWQAAASATNETDWALFAYLVPQGTATAPGKTLYITSIRIGETVVTGAAGVNATSFFWAAAVGSSTLGSGTVATAVSLATAEAVAGVTTSTSPRRVALGSQSFLAAAPIATQSPGFTVDFSSAPLVAQAGTYVHIILKQLNGAATASLVWRGTVTVVGYWE